MTRPDDASLRDLLARVHERLSHADKLDPETRRLLVKITRDIEHTLGSPTAPGRSGAVAAGGDRAEVHRQSLASLDGLVARFDADHPALAQALRQLIDYLGKAGI